MTSLLLLKKLSLAQNPVSYKKNQSVLQGEYFNLPGIPDQCLDLVKRCLDYNASNRITVCQALDHPYFTNPQGWARKPQAEQSAEVRYIEEQDNNDLSVSQWKRYIWNEMHEVSV